MRALVRSEDNTKGAPILPQTTGTPRGIAHPLSRAASTSIQDGTPGPRKTWGERELTALARVHQLALRLAIEGKEKAATGIAAVGVGDGLSSGQRRASS